MAKLYNLGPDGEPIAVSLADFRISDERQVAVTEVGESEVSTIFLGIDARRPFGNGPPILWETMVFGGPLDRTCWRYTSREEAERGHAELVKQLTERAPP